MPIHDTPADDLRFRIAALKAMKPGSPSMERLREQAIRDLQRDLAEAVRIEQLASEYS